MERENLTGELIEWQVKWMSLLAIIQGVGWGLVFAGVIFLLAAR